MFLSRLEGMLGTVPGQYRAIPALKRRRVRQNFRPNTPQEETFFGTSSLSTEANTQSRKREVARLFERMRGELLEIAQEFAEDLDDSGNNLNLRHGMFLEMIIASEFVCDELDSLIASLCESGSQAEKQGEAEKLELICQNATMYSCLRKRISEFQKELASMVEVTASAFQRYCIETSLNFDPIVQHGEDLKPFITQFLCSVDECITVMTQLAADMLSNRDFETAAQLCTCNVQLSNFVMDASKIISST